MSETSKTPKQDLMNAALEHYEEAAQAVGLYNNDVVRAIKMFYAPNLEDYKERVIIEQMDLQEKVNKLEDFLNGPERKNPETVAQMYILEMQLDAMKIYLKCLNARVRIFTYKP